LKGSSPRIGHTTVQKSARAPPQFEPLVRRDYFRDEALLGLFESERCDERCSFSDLVVMENLRITSRTKQSICVDPGDEEKQSLVVHRDDFWASTSNKQLNFLQHVFTTLKQHGRAAIVVPDNILFESGAGECLREAH
jgi:hypothetical protein